MIVLIGPPGTGKTTVGELLAAELGVGFRDTDRDVEEAAGTSISDIFIEQGEAAFRSLEREAVAKALREHDGVLSVGGGAVLAEETRNALRGHDVVFLDVGLADASRRVGLGQSRPVLMLNPRSELTRLLAARRPLYIECATHSVDTTDRDPAEVVALVREALGR